MQRFMTLLQTRSEHPIVAPRPLRIERISLSGSCHRTKKKRARRPAFRYSGRPLAALLGARVVAALLAVLARRFVGAVEAGFLVGAVRLALCVRGLGIRA